MTHSEPDHHDPSLDLFLDGMLADEQQRAFEQRLLHDPALRAEVEAQRHIDQAIRRVYQPTRFTDPRPLLPIKAADTNGRVRQAASPSAARAHRFKQVLALAAVLGLVTFAGWQVWQFVSPPNRVDPYAPQPWRSLETVYRDELKDGFKPDWVCEEEVFARTFKRRLGEALVLADGPADARMVGLAYSNSLSPKTIHMLARVGEAPVVVFADRADKMSAAPVLPPESRLKLYRATVGDLVLFELSPLDQPHFLARFRSP